MDFWRLVDVSMNALSCLLESAKLLFLMAYMPHFSRVIHPFVRRSDTSVVCRLGADLSTLLLSKRLNTASFDFVLITVLAYPFVSKITANTALILTDAPILCLPIVTEATVIVCPLQLHVSMTRRDANRFTTPYRFVSLLHGEQA